MAGIPGSMADPAEVSEKGFYAVQSSTGQCQAWSQANEISSFLMKKMDSSHKYTWLGSLHFSSSFTKLGESSGRIFPHAETNAQRTKQYRERR